MPQNIVVQDDRLYFSKVYKGVRYTGAFGLFDTPANREKADLTARQIRHDMKYGSFSAANYPMLVRNQKPVPDTSFPTVARYANDWLDGIQDTLAESTFRDYRGQIKKYVVPFLGDTPVDQIDKHLIKRWLAWLKPQISTVYAGDCLQRLKSMIAEAEDDFDFVSKIRKIKPPRSSEPANPNKDAIYTLEELSRMYRASGIRMRTMLTVSAFAGLRPGELIALKREDVDFALNRLHVRATMSLGKRVRPKTEKGVRSIQLHPVVRDCLEEVLSTHNHDYVFISERGQPLRYTQCFSDEYRRTRDKAGVPGLRWYSLRKLFASMRFASHESVPTRIAKEMGHSKVSMSLDVYAEAMPHLGCKFEDIKFPVTSHVNPGNNGTIADNQSARALPEAGRTIILGADMMSLEIAPIRYVE